MIYTLTPAEHDALNAFALKIETGVIAPRRLAVELLLLRLLCAACRYPRPGDLDPRIKAALDRIPLATQTQAWTDLARPEFKQLDLAGK